MALQDTVSAQNGSRSRTGIAQQQQVLRMQLFFNYRLVSRHIFHPRHPVVIGPGMLVQLPNIPRMIDPRLLVSVRNGTFLNLHVFDGMQGWLEMADGERIDIKLFQPIRMANGSIWELEAPLEAVKRVWIEYHRYILSIVMSDASQAAEEEWRSGLPYQATIPDVEESHRHLTVHMDPPISEVRSASAVVHMSEHQPSKSQALVIEMRNERKLLADHAMSRLESIRIGRNAPMFQVPDLPIPFTLVHHSVGRVALQFLRDPNWSCSVTLAGSLRGLNMQQLIAQQKAVPVGSDTYRVPFPPGSRAYIQIGKYLFTLSWRDL